MEICDTCIRGDQISHVQSMVAKRGLTNSANVPINPAILDAIGHRFVAKKFKFKMLRRRAWRPETGDFYFGLTKVNLSQN